jgi:ATP/maltotriose-dependent transcriptional regulator MalT
VRRTSGDLAGAGHCLERARELSRAAGDERGTAWARNDLGGIAYYRGRVEEALALVEEAVGSFARLGMGFGGYQAQVHLGGMRLQVGQPARALACFERASAIQEGQHFVGHGAELLEGVAEVAAGMHRFELAATLLGAGDSWQQIFGHAHADSTLFSDPSAPVASRRRLGQAEFDEAYQAGRRLRWDQSQALLRSTIAELSVALSGSHAGLTTREVEVLQLVALGLSNGEIGERLVVSTRTVHAHLRSIYDKLGVTTRTAAAREAVRIGLT